MTNKLTREDCLGTVMKSPQAVAIRNKEAWLSIFARYNIVEDPIGSTPVVSGVYDARSGVRGPGPLGRFFDTFIAPMDIVFHVERDIVCGLGVARDLTIEIKMSPKVTVHVPMHVLYELVEEDGVLKIQRLAAHWELRPMLLQQMSFGLASLSAIFTATLRMIRHLGILGMLRFMKAVSNIGQTGKDVVSRFVDGLNRQSSDSMHSTLSSRFAGVALPAATPVRQIGQLLQMKGQLTLGKTLAAGNVVTASCTLETEGKVWKGIAFFEFDMNEKKIHRVNFHVE